MQNKTNIGASLGQMIAGAFNPAMQLQGARDAASVAQAQALMDFTRIKAAGQESENAILERQKNLNADDIALGDMGITGPLAASLKSYAKNGDYGNGFMSVPNLMEDGTMNLANSSIEKPIKPTGWDENLAKDFMRRRSLYDYSIGMGEKNPESVQKAIGAGRDNDFMAGAGDDVLQYGQRKAAVSGKSQDIQTVNLLQKISENGGSQEELEAAARALILGKGQKLFDFSKDGVGNVVTGDFAPNQTPKNGGDEKDWVWDSGRGLMINKVTGEAKRPTVNGAPVTQEADGAFVDMGLPRPTRLPWDGIQDPKQKAIMQGRRYDADSKLLDSFKEEVDKAKGFADDAEQFLALNRNVATGGLDDRFFGTRWLNSLDSDYQTMQALSAKAAPSMRPPGAGATSDFDARQYERATFGVDKSGNTNKAIVQARVAYAKNLEDYQEFRRAYLEQNGTLAGADNYWKRYSDQNPIFDKSKAGTFGLNKGRRGWREVFDGISKGGQTGRQTTPKPAVNRQVVRTGTDKRTGKKVVQYSDGAMEYAE